MDAWPEKKISNLARGIKASDEAAFSKLFHLLYPHLVKFAWRYTNAKPSAKDIVQESFMKIWEKRHSIDPKQSLVAYIYQIVRNRSMNHLRDRNREPGTTALEDVPCEMLRSRDYIPEVISAPDEAGKKMLNWIDQLPPRRREAIRLSRFEGLDHQEIAHVMDISAKTVNNHIVAALKTLKKRYRNDQRGNNNTIYDGKEKT